jgi:hypothetical protein
MASISRFSLVRNPNPQEEGDPAERPRSADEAEAEVRARFEDVITAVRRAATDENISFKTFEVLLRDHVMAFALAAVVLFLVLCEARVSAAFVGGVERGGRRFRVAPARARSLTTIFGVVRYWRTYMREVGPDACRGFHPLDVALGLTADRLSANVLSNAVRLATKVAYAEARSILTWFMDAVPSTEVIEKAVLGLGRHTAKWFETAPAPDGDGEVLIIHFDSKGAPTATAEELARRRGKRRPKPAGASPRHRGRARRKRHPKKRRRKKGDKSKNAKMATAFVMYTLRREGEFLVGPINKRVYASFGPKEHVFEIARREATKRGFGPDSQKLIQILTDGDTDLALYAKRHFPEARHTIDVMHVIEKLWSAGAAIYREGSDALSDWMHVQRSRLYEGRIHLILDDLRGALERTPKTGPGNKGKRARLDEVKHYIESRQANMNYAELLELDLEIGTGPIEGVVKNVIGKRCDHGGMRWIKERAEALLQLRCIEVNGDWDAFIDRVHDENRRRGIEEGARIRLQHATAAPLPTVTRCAA